jgi:hypothetical protein
LITRSGFLSSCSHMRTTFHPSRVSDRFTNRSRLRLDESFVSQNSRLLEGTFAQRGHECQKHPSTKTATRSRLKAKSGLPTICR